MLIVLGKKVKGLRNVNKKAEIIFPVVVETHTFFHSDSSRPGPWFKILPSQISIPIQTIPTYTQKNFCTV